MPVFSPKSLTVNELRRPDLRKSLIYKDLRKKENSAETKVELFSTNRLTFEANGFMLRYV